jgi:hypothetical protein
MNSSHVLYDIVRQYGIFGFDLSIEGSDKSDQRKRLNGLLKNSQIACIDYKNDENKNIVITVPLNRIQLELLKKEADDVQIYHWKNPNLRMITSLTCIADRIECKAHHLTGHYLLA